MKVVIWSSSPRGLVVAEMLRSLGHEICCVVTNDKSLWTLETEKSWRGTQFLNAENLDEGEIGAILGLANPDIGVVAGFRKRLPKGLAAIPTLGTINLHAGPLPEFRGGSPLSWQIISGRKKIGVTAHILVHDWDAGPILSREEFSLSPEENIGTARSRADLLLAQMAGQLLSGEPEFLKAGEPQDERLAKYWHQRTYHDAEIKWELMSAEEVNNLVRATSPDYGGAFTFHRARRLRVYQTRVASPRLAGVPGRVLRLGNEGGLFVLCAENAVQILDYEPAGSIFRRNHLKTGMILGK